jgi:hypothetical protein
MTHQYYYYIQFYIVDIYRGIIKSIWNLCFVLEIITSIVIAAIFEIMFQIVEVTEPVLV